VYPSQVKPKAWRGGGRQGSRASDAAHHAASSLTASFSVCSTRVMPCYILSGGYKTVGVCVCSTSGGGRHRAPGVTRGKRASALAPLYIFTPERHRSNSNTGVYAVSCGMTTTAMMMFCNKSARRQREGAKVRTICSLSLPPFTSLSLACSPCMLCLFVMFMPGRQTRVSVR
jgi:hypothetical protein